MMCECFMLWHLMTDRQAELLSSVGRTSCPRMVAEEPHRQAELDKTDRPKGKTGRPNMADEQSVEIFPKLWLS